MINPITVLFPLTQFIFLLQPEIKKNDLKINFPINIS